MGKESIVLFAFLQFFEDECDEFDEFDDWNLTWLREWETSQIPGNIQQVWMTVIRIVIVGVDQETSSISCFSVVELGKEESEKVISSDGDNQMV